MIASRFWTRKMLTALKCLLEVKIIVILFLLLKIINIDLNLWFFKNFPRRLCDATASKEEKGEFQARGYNAFASKWARRRLHIKILLLYFYIKTTIWFFLEKEGDKSDPIVCKNNGESLLLTLEKPSPLGKKAENISPYAAPFEEIKAKFTTKKS